MRDASILLLLVFTTIASVDGFYFHLYKYRLYERPDSRREHLLHTLNGCLFPLTLAPVYLAQAAGGWLWFAVAANVITLAIESLDVFTEKASRASLGGLTSTEYWMHFLMSGLRWGYVALAFASVDRAAWTAPTSWSWTPPSPSALLAAVPWGIAIVGIPVAILHVLLARAGRPRRVAEGMLLLRGAVGT
jgi:hypothetical protein